MKLRRIFFAVVVLSIVAAPRAAWPASTIDIQAVETDSGITAWLVEEPSLPLISLAAAFRGGAAMDSQGKTGLAHMVSGLLDEGAGDMKATEFQTALENKAIRMSFSAGYDTFSVRLRTLSEFRKEAFRLLGLALTEPRFDPQPVERIRRQIMVSLKRQQEDPQAIAARRWREAYFGDHPYGRPSDGTLETVSEIERADLERFVDNRFARDNLVVAIVGDVTPEEAKALIDSAFADLPKKAEPYIVPPVDTPETGKTIRVARDVPQAVVRFGHQGIKRDDPDWYAAYVMNYILGGGTLVSRLNDVVREEHGLAYGVSSGFRPMDYYGLFLGRVGTDRDAVGKSIDLIKREITRMADEGATAAELAAAKSHITGSYPLSFDSTSEIAGQLLGIQLEDLGIDYVDRRNGLIEDVTLDDVNRVAKKLLHPDNLLWVVVGGPSAGTEADAAGAPAE